MYSSSKATIVEPLNREPLNPEPEYSSGFPFRVETQSDKQAGGVRQIADEPAHRLRKFPDEGWSRDDVAVARKDGLLIDVNHFQFEVAIEFGCAQLTGAQNGLARSVGGPGNVQSQ